MLGEVIGVGVGVGMTGWIAYVLLTATAVFWFATTVTRSGAMATAVTSTWSLSPFSGSLIVHVAPAGSPVVATVAEPAPVPAGILSSARSVRRRPQGCSTARTVTGPCNPAPGPLTVLVTSIPPASNGVIRTPATASIRVVWARISFCALSRSGLLPS